MIAHAQYEVRPNVVLLATSYIPITPIAVCSATDFTGIMSALKPLLLVLALTTIVRGQASGKTLVFSTKMQSK